MAQCAPHGMVTTDTHRVNGYRISTTKDLLLLYGYGASRSVRPTGDRRTTGVGRWTWLRRRVIGMRVRGVT